MSPLLSTENHFAFGTCVPVLIRHLLTFPALSVAVVCVAMLLAVPFVLPVNGLPVPTFYQEWIAVALGCTAFLAVVAAQGKSGIEVPRISLLPLGILLLVLIQMALGRLIYWQQGAIAAIYLLWSVAMLCVGRTLRQRLGWDDFCMLAAQAVCIGALLSAVIGVLQLIGLGLVVPMIGAQVHANLGQPNHIANYLCLGLIALFYLACTQRLNMLAAGGAMFFLLALVNFSGSRSVWLYLAVAALLALLTYRGARSKQTRALVLWSAAAIVTLLALHLVSGSLSEDSALWQATVGARISAADAGPSHRSNIWLTSLLMFKSAPLTGVGFKGFAWNHFLTAGPLPAGIPEEITDNAHNLVFQFFAEFGLPGGIIVIGAAIVWWLARLREKPSVHHWWIFSLVAIISLHTVLEYPLWYAYFLGPFALFLGAGDKAVWHIRPASLSRLAVAGLGMAMVWTLASVLFDYRHVERLGLVAETGSLQRDIGHEVMSVSGSSLFIDILELGLARTIQLDRSELDAKIALNGRVLRTYPAGDVAYRQSALLALAGDLPAAYRHWDLAVSVYPSRAMKVAKTLAQRSSMGEARLAPLVEYAASRTKE